MEKLEGDFQRVYNKGVGSLSVVLMHSIHVSGYQFYLMELSHKL